MPDAALTSPDADPEITPADVITEDLAEAAHTFNLLGSPIRTQVLWLLSQREYDVSTLAEVIHASVPTVSHHLGKLRLTNLVSVRAEGRHQIYRVDDPHIIALVNAAVEHHADLRLRDTRKN